MDLDSRPRLWRLARLEHDSVRGVPVLLFPEGLMLLNDTGAAILALCDGGRTVREIASILAERYQADVTSDVLAFLRKLAARELVLGDASFA